MDSLSDRGFHATAAHLSLTDDMHSPPASEHVTLMCRLRTDLRKQVLGNGILHVLRSGCRWKDCPLKMSRPPRLMTLTTGGVRRGSSTSCSRAWRRPGIFPTSSASTAPHQGTPLRGRVKTALPRCYSTTSRRRSACRRSEPRSSSVQQDKTPSIPAQPHRRPQAQRRRAHVLPNEGLAPHRHGCDRLASLMHRISSIGNVSQPRRLRPSPFTDLTWCGSGGGS